MGRWGGLAAGVALGVVLSVGFYVAADPKAAPGWARIGVVDFGRLLDNYEKMKDREKEITDRQNSLRQEAQKRSEAIRQLDVKLAMHTPGSKAHNDTENEITTKRAEFDTWMKIKAREVLDRQRGAIREVYYDIERASAAFAKANGLNFVMKTDRIELTVPSVRELDMRVTLKKILYRADSVDITDRVLASLNATYRRDKAGAR